MGVPLAKDEEKEHNPVLRTNKKEPKQINHSSKIQEKRMVMVMGNSRISRYTCETTDCVRAESERTQKNIVKMSSIYECIYSSRFVWYDATKTAAATDSNRNTEQIKNMIIQTDRNHLDYLNFREVPVHKNITVGCWMLVDVEEN